MKHFRREDKMKIAVNDSAISSMGEIDQAACLTISTSTFLRNATREANPFRLAYVDTITRENLKACDMLGKMTFVYRL